MSGAMPAPIEPRTMQAGKINSLLLGLILFAPKHRNTIGINVK